MGRPLRVVHSGRYHFITNRCLAGQYLLRPDDESRRIILGVLAKAVEDHNVEVVCFVFMSNHFHLICGFPDANMAEFMGQLTSQLSRRLNKLRGRTGPMFPRRYHDQVLMDEVALLTQIKYVVNNPVKDALVEKAEDWPGVTSIDARLSDGTVTGEWRNGVLYNRLKQKHGDDFDPEDAWETYSFELETPEGLEGGDEEARCEALLAAITEHRHDCWASETGDPEDPPAVVGAEAVKDQRWTRRAGPPKSSSNTRLCLADDRQVIDDYYDEHQRRTESYRAAADRRKRGEWAEFPYGTYPPGDGKAWTEKRVWMLRPMDELDENAVTLF